MNAYWIFNRNGQATIIWDGDCFRNKCGQVIAWTTKEFIYNIRGQHVGWFEEGVLYDSFNRALGFVRDCTGYLPSLPGISGTPGMPGFTGKPGKPIFSSPTGRPGLGSWSSENLENYFSS